MQGLKFTHFFWIFACVLLIPLTMHAAVMSSPTYKIQTDSINGAGGFSTSSSFQMQDTLGEIGSGFSSSTSYQLNAGYQAMQAVYISISSAGNVTLPNLGGISGGASTGNSTWKVTTDDAAGYTLSVSAATSPALKSASSSISNYQPATANPDYNFAVGAASSTFGFSPEGIDIVQRYKDNGSACNTGTTDTTDRCWDAFSTSNTLIAQSAAGNHPNGATTTLKYQAAIGTNKIQDAGTYTSTITVTAVAL